MDKLVYANNTLYAKTATELVASLDGGESWTRVLHPEIAILHYNPEMPTSMMKFNDSVYVKGIKETAPQLFRVSAENNGLLPVPGMPSLAEIGIETLIGETVKNVLRESVQDELEKNIEEGTGLKPEDFDLKLEDFDLKPEDFDLKPEDFNMDMLSTVANEVIEEGIIKLIQMYLGSFAVSGSTHYMEYNQQLFRWKPGMTEWFNTGLADAGESIHSVAALQDQGSVDFKIGVSGKTIYVGKRDGHLLQSFDEGDTWNDVTTNLPFSAPQFKAIAFAGPTLYVATDKGVTYSSDGTRWHTATDAEGTPIVIEKFAVDGTTVYGATEQQIYQLKENSITWKQVTPEVPIKITSLAVDGNTLYVGTPGHGVLRFTIDETD